MFLVIMERGVAGLLDLLVLFVRIILLSPLVALTVLCLQNQI